MNRSSQGRALFYTRDSGGRHENTPLEYVAWAQRKAEEIGLAFDGTPERIDAMIRQGVSAHGDLYLDYGVPGNVLSRDGLNALIKEAVANPSISHILIPRRDRLARPDDHLDGGKLESVLRTSGKTLIFMDKTLPPLSKGRKQDIAELLVAVLDYDRSDEYRHDLAQKIVFAQIRLAKLGFSTGGRPPFGFDRWLAKEDGTPVRLLQAGERIRMPGHHVVWLPGSEERLAIVRRILEMLNTMPASRVAATLTAESIPSPDSGRLRKDNGVRHPVSGVWHQTTITSIARNPLLAAYCSYGARSMGDKRRYTAEGPRYLEEADYRDGNKPRVIRNSEDAQIVVPAKFQPLIEPEEHRQLVAKLDARAGIQRGKPRASDPRKNPLGCRIFDMNCSWPMYREPYNGTFRYKCGLYQQSHGQRCAHNHVDGPTATRFVLACLRQRIVTPRFMTLVERRLRELAGKDEVVAQQPRGGELTEKRAALQQLDGDLKKVSRNLALAASEEQYRAVADVFDELKKRKHSLEAEVSSLESHTSPKAEPGDEITAALDLAQRLTDLVTVGDDLEVAGKIIQLTNTRLFLNFRPIKAGTRVVNRIGGGVVTIGASPPPMPIYEGPTSRRQVKGLAVTESALTRTSGLNPPEVRIISGRVVDSLGNVNRGDWI